MDNEKNKAHMCIALLLTLNTRQTRVQWITLISNKAVPAIFPTGAGICAEHLRQNASLIWDNVRQRWR